MKVTIVGTGYVGLVTGACLAEMGHVVTCVDKNEDRIKGLINDLNPPFYEPGLSEIIRQQGSLNTSHNSTECFLNFSTTLSSIINSDVVFICVGTPEGRGGLDMSHVEDAVKEVSELYEGVVVVKSTVPVGTCSSLQVKYPALDIVSNPEFLKEGHAVEDFRRPDRIVVGSSSDRGFSVMKNLYSHFIRNGHQFFEMSTKASELTKLASNAMLATRISFMNQIASICSRS